MGSPSAVITVGLGSWGSAALLLTLGYGAGVATVDPNAFRVSDLIGSSARHNLTGSSTRQEAMGSASRFTLTGSPARAGVLEGSEARV